ncbi:DUF6431 domain-containing protein [Calorimonas adulescens]|uniref:DUF6431 domain-containing protein n=1 Tax=Calorimonas adulescens TaxID=2606906 RepID=UPI001EF0BB6B|nr:DUF6431 domain-containing protein [Calorimonas adulescens]
MEVAIRRYICPVCSKTVSSLPDFCLPHFQYSIDLTVMSVNETMSRDTIISSFIAKLREFSPYTVFSRQHIYFYTRRVIDNLGFIMYGLRQIDPCIKFSNIPNDRMRAREILDILGSSIPIFSQRFYTACQKSFLAPLT